MNAVSMPITHRIDPDQRLIVVAVSGTVGQQDILDAQKRIRTDPLFRPDMRQLNDLRAVEKVNVNSDGVRMLVANSHLGAGGRRAFVTPGGMPYAMARMFEILSDLRPEKTAVFRDMQEALEWLGLEPVVNA